MIVGAAEQLSVADLNFEALKDSKYLYIEGYLVTSRTGREASIAARKVAEANGVKTVLTLSDKFKLTEGFEKSGSCSNKKTNLFYVLINIIDVK